MDDVEVQKVYLLSEKVLNRNLEQVNTGEDVEIC